MKKLTLIAVMLVAFSFDANAYTISKVGSFNAYQYNEFLDKHIAKKGEVWVGITEEGKENVIVRIDGGLKTLEITMARDSGTYEYFTTAINKMVEWTEVAKTNSVDIKKDFPNQNVGCHTWTSRCSMSFSSWANGQKSTMYLNLKDTENQFYTFNGQIIYSDVTLLKEIIDTQVQIGLDKRRSALVDDPANKEDLFQ